MNKWDLLLPALKRMLIALVLMRHHQYVPKVISHLNVLLYHQKYNTKIWKMHSDDPACFNEEPGELSFALLGRAKGNDAKQDIFQHLNNLYPLINSCIDRSDHSDRQDTGYTSRAGRKQSQRFRVDAGSIDTVAVLAFFMTTINELKTGTFSCYDGTPESYKSKQHANSSRVISGKSTTWRTVIDFESNLNEYIKKTKSQLIGNNIISDTSDKGLSWTISQHDLFVNDVSDHEIEFVRPDDIINSEEEHNNSVYSMVSQEQDGDEDVISIQTMQPQMSSVYSLPSSASPISVQQNLDDENKHQSEGDSPFNERGDIVERKQVVFDIEPIDSHEDELSNDSSDHSLSTRLTGSSQAGVNDKDEIASIRSNGSYGIPEIILEQKLNKNRLKCYKIKWMGEPKKDATWEFAHLYDPFSDYKFLLDDWKRNMKTTGKGNHRKRKRNQ